MIFQVLSNSRKIGKTTAFYCISAFILFIFISFYYYYYCRMIHTNLFIIVLQNVESLPILQILSSISFIEAVLSKHQVIVKTRCIYLITFIQMTCPIVSAGRMCKLQFQLFYTGFKTLQLTVIVFLYAISQYILYFPKILYSKGNFKSGKFG